MVANTARFKFLDGLRGVAILLVMFYHFYHLQLFSPETSSTFLKSLDVAGALGKMGVYIFFVISGFIVSYITFEKVTSWKFIGNFILRRQIRLDPPYWLAVLLGAVIAWASVTLLHNRGHIPSIIDLITNFTYTFDILHYYDITRVGWTLCLEIQFYICFILFMFFCFRYTISNNVIIILNYLLFLISLAFLIYTHDAGRMFITNHWFIFFLGIAVTLNLKKVISDKIYYLIVLTPLGLLLLFPSLHDPVILFSVFTSLAIFVAFKRGKESMWLSSPFFQFFGLISYSLYLTHCLIGNRIIRFLKEYWLWHPDNILLTFVILLIAIAISTLFAALFYYGIEKRSTAWSKKFTSQ